MLQKVGSALSVNGVSYSYGSRQALDDVTFSVMPGTFAVILGSNGAGKTTLFSLITRLFQTRTGSISIMGHDLQRTPGQALRRLGVVFQARTLDLDLSIGQNLSYHASLHGMRHAESSKRVSEVLAQVDLANRQSEKARNLSGGQMRRVEIARALLHEPDVLLLDEATVGLDVRSRLAIQGIIRQLVATRNLSVLWSTHLIDEVAAADEVLVLNRGQLIAQGSRKEIEELAGTSDIQSAFIKLTSAAREPGMPENAEQDS